MGAATKAAVTQEEADQIRDMVAQGVTRQDIAKALGWGLSTLYKRMEKDQKLKKAMEVGLSIDYDFCKGILRQQAEKGSFAHLAGYMRLVHKVDITSGDGNKSGGGVQLVVNINLAPTESASEIKEIAGEIIDQLDSPQP